MRTIFFHLTYYPWTVIVLLLALPISLLGENAVHNWAIFWGRTCLWLSGIRLKVTGAENIPQNSSAIYISNHQSNFDIPILYAGLPIQFRWMAKKELFDIPLFGLAMKRCGYIEIDRSDRRKSMSSITAAAKRIKAGASVIIFPEGTRTTDGRLQEFKKGGFLIAAKAQVPVVPVAIRGSYHISAKGSRTVTSGSVEMEIFPAIETTDFKNTEIKQLIAQVRRPIATMLGEKDDDEQHAA